MLKISVLLVVFAVVFLFPIAPSGAQEMGSPAAGEAYAKRICIECHGISDKVEMSPNLTAPSFKEIADTRGMTRQALLVWFRTPHPTMPNLVLEMQNEEDIIAYILSLKKTDE
ncbi:MAG: c-type cytochrome [Methyloligellaceae bacterium]